MGLRSGMSEPEEFDSSLHDLGSPWGLPGTGGAGGGGWGGQSRCFIWPSSGEGRSPGQASSAPSFMNKHSNWGHHR